MSKRFDLWVCAVLLLAGSCFGGENPPAEGAGAPTGLRIARVIEVTDGSTIYMQPVWSLDGKKLAFTKSGFTGVYVRNADGSGPITEIASADYLPTRALSRAPSLSLRVTNCIVGWYHRCGQVKQRKGALYFS